MKQNICELKQELKLLACQIRETRALFKEAQRAGSGYWVILSKLAKTQSGFRSKHIVASLLRGRTRDQIENPVGRCEKENCYCCNKPNEKEIARLLNFYQEKANERLEEALRPGQVGSGEEFEGGTGLSRGCGMDEKIPQPLLSTVG